MRSGYRGRIRLEILIVIAIVASFFAFTLISHISSFLLLTLGVVCIVVGLVIGIPVGLYYHLLLFHRKGLIEGGVRGWWLSPQRYHTQLPEKDRKLLNRWFWAGAVFFNIAIIGCGLVFVGLLAG